MQPIEKFNPTNLNESHLNALVERINILSKIKTSGGIMSTVDNTGVMIWKKKEEATGDFPFPNGRVTIQEANFTAGEMTLVKETHERKWIYVMSGGFSDYRTIYMPVSPTVDDIYYFFMPYPGAAQCYLKANTDQTIVMPTEDVTGDDKIWMDNMGALYNGASQLIVICTGTNQWTCWYSLASYIV